MTILFHFAACKKLKETASTHSELCFAMHDSYLELLSKEFHVRFCDFSSFEHQFALFSAPFACDVNKVEGLQLEFLDIQPDSTLRAKFFGSVMMGIYTMGGLLKCEYLHSSHTFLRSSATSESLP